MAKIRPVASDDRFTLVEHLGELRTRIITALAIFVVAFAFAYWQNHRVLDIVNNPLEKSQSVSKQCKTPQQSLDNSACFDRAVAVALGKLQPLVTSLTTGASPPQVATANQAITALRKAQSLAPRSATRKPVTLGVAEPFFQTLNVAMYAALVISLPLLLYQLYAFLIPAFTSRERRIILPLLIGVPFLFYGGVAFGYFLALPRAVDFLQNFNSQSFDVLVQAKDYYKFVALVLAGCGLVFQTPVVIIAISRLGILSARQLRKKRGIAWIVAAVIAAVITPTPDAVTMLLMMAPLVVLFEISVMIAAILERRSPTKNLLGSLRSGWDDDDEDDEGGFPDDDDPDDGPPSSGGELAAPVGAPEAVFGEDPDPELLGDPTGPRLATEPPPEPEPPPAAAAPVDLEPDGLTDPAGWLAQADLLDADDPYASDDPPNGHTDRP